MRLEISKRLGAGTRQAWFSDEDEPLFRYRLEVELAGNGPPLGFLLHNPSTASHLEDDRTWTRVVGFAVRENASRLIVMNPAARRTPKPDALRAMVAAGEDIFGPDNPDAIRRGFLDLADARGRLVVGFGAVSGPRPFREAFAAAVRDAIAITIEMGLPLLALGANADGSPKHPLYLAADASLVSWECAPATGFAA